MVIENSGVMAGRLVAAIAVPFPPKIGLSESQSPKNFVQKCII